MKKKVYYIAYYKYDKFWFYWLQIIVFLGFKEKIHKIRLVTKIKINKVEKWKTS